MLKQKLIIGAAALAATSFALAGGPGDFDAPSAPQQGIYVDANFGWAVNDFKPAATSNLTEKSDSGFAANANLGYQFSENLAAEFGFFYLPDWKANQADGDITNNYGYDLAVKGILPFGGQFNAFAKLGVGLSTAKVGTAILDPKPGSRNGVAGFGALGLGWTPAAMPDLTLNVQGFAFTKANKLAGRYGVLGGVGYLFPM